ncbi:MAG: glycosyltransferase family 39 protein, partial [Candidatus Spechtbacterales bacterium]|nr:glycosyltransferase family 39 protein [Candidatus Spechtbacterales bacterium]
MKKDILSKLPSKITATIIVAGLILSSMAVLMLAESVEKSTIVDESPHIVAGYAYVVKQDYRLNPEHPPLIKMAAGLPLAFLDLNFIEGRQSWEKDVNGQWTGGDQFLHWQGNNPRQMMFWSRLGPLVITLLLGVLVFMWARKLYNNMAGIFALTLFAFSPTFLAHGPLVTTDVGAAFAFVFASYFFFKYLKDQTRKNLIMAGVAFGIAQLMKFSLVLIIPFFTVAALMWAFFKEEPVKFWSGEMAKRTLAYFGKLLAIGVVGLIVVYPVYLYTVSGYPIERQISDTESILRSHPWNPAPNSTDQNPREVQGIPGGVVEMAKNPVLRPYAQFFLGHLMVFQRVAGGNTVYYLGDIASTAWRSYFPVVFMLKVPLALLAMLLITTGAATRAGLRQLRIATRGLKNTKDKFKEFIKLKHEWISRYFIEASFLFFIAMYWLISIMGNLNIGVRHVLPTFPFIYILLAGVIHRWIRPNVDLKGMNLMEKIQAIFAALFKGWTRGAVILVLVIWYVFSPL